MKTNDKKTKNIIRLDLSKCDMGFLIILSEKSFVNENSRMMQTLAEELKSRLGDAGVKTCIANVIPYISDELMRPFIGQGADEIIAEYCTDSQILLELLKLCKSNVSVVVKVASNVNTDEETIRFLVNEFYYITGIYHGLLKRNNLSIDVMKTIACHPDEQVKIQLAKYKEAPTEILWLLLENSKSRELRLYIARHPNATADILKFVLQSEKQEETPDESVFEAISEHKDIMTDDILLELLNFWKGNHQMVQWTLDESNASNEVLAYVCNDMKEYISLLEYDQTPVEILEQILQLEDGESYAEGIAIHPNANEQLLMEVVQKFGTNRNVLLKVIQHQNMTRKILDFIIFEVVEQLPWLYGDGLSRNDVRNFVYEQRCKLVKFE